MTTAELIIKHEGLRLKPYKCPADKWTIGVGRNLEDVGITEAEAMTMLANDIYRVERELESLSFSRHLNAARTAAITDMLFNLGLSRFLRFRKMIAALEAQDYERAADEALNSKWARQVGHRAQTIAAMLSAGEFTE